MPEWTILRILRHVPIDALPGDVVACSWDLRERQHLGELLRLMAACPLVRVAAIVDPADFSAQETVNLASPGWHRRLTWQALPAYLDASAVPRGLGLHHFGVHWTGAPTGANGALAALFESAGVGPTLAAEGRRLRCHPDSLCRAIREDCRLGYRVLKERRAMALVLGFIAGRQVTMAAAARSLGWPDAQARAAFVREGMDWRRFAEPDGRAALRQMLVTFLPSPRRSPRNLTGTSGS